MSGATRTSLRAGCVWAHSGGLLARRHRGWASLVWPLTLSVQWVGAAVCANQLRTTPGAAIIVADRPRRAAPVAVLAALGYALALWGGIAVALVVLSTRLGAAVVLALPLLALVVGVEIAGSNAHGLGAWLDTHRRTTALHRGGAVRLHSLAAWPRGRGAGQRLMDEVCAGLDAGDRAAVLDCRAELVSWYAGLGFADVGARPGAVMVRRPRVSAGPSGVRLPRPRPARPRSPAGHPR